MTQRTCLDCATPISARSNGGRCRSCGLAAVNRARATRPADPQCSDCGGIVSHGSLRCRHCAADQRRVHQSSPTMDRTADGTAASDARLGCEGLLRAHLRTGQHWLVDPEAFAAACRGVGLWVAL